MQLFVVFGVVDGLKLLVLLVVLSGSEVERQEAIAVFAYMHANVHTRCTYCR